MAPSIFIPGCPKTKGLHQGNEPVRDFVYVKITLRMTIYSMKEVIKKYTLQIIKRLKFVKILSC